MEETLWNIEDKWKLSTQKVIALFACTSFLVITICITVALIRRKSRQKGIVHQEPSNITENWAEPPDGGARWHTMKKVLIGSVRWSGPNKWKEEEGLRRSQRETPTSLLVRRGAGDDDQVGMQSHNSTSAVWQRPILMGEKCELPRFSGLILYDQRGKPLHQYEQEGITTTENQEKTEEAVRTTLRDLL